MCGGGDLPVPPTAGAGRVTDLLPEAITWCAVGRAVAPALLSRVLLESEAATAAAAAAPAPLPVTIDLDGPAPRAAPDPCRRPLPPLPPRLPPLPPRPLPRPVSRPTRTVSRHPTAKASRRRDCTTSEGRGRPCSPVPGGRRPAQTDLCAMLDARPWTGWDRLRRARCRSPLPASPSPHPTPPRPTPAACPQGHRLRLVLRGAVLCCQPGCPEKDDGSDKLYLESVNGSNTHFENTGYASESHLGKIGRVILMATIPLPASR